MRKFIKRLYEAPTVRLNYFAKADAIVMSGYEGLSNYDRLVDDVNWD